jgi:hypothetical protein
MLNLRGLLTRLLGFGHEQGIFALCLAVLAATSVVVYLRLRRHGRAGRVPAVAFATALALELPVNLHLHLQDAAVWLVPLAIFVGHLRARGGDWMRFATFALCWPLVFVATNAVETARGTLLPVPPALLLAVALAVWMVRELAAEEALA